MHGGFKYSRDCFQGFHPFSSISFSWRFKPWVAATKLATVSRCLRLDASEAKEEAMPLTAPITIVYLRPNRGSPTR
ncbi:hypothetical protein HYQ46_002056 [Verticillium longisporum]|nr:hypothetical protein HYQ46_002056 [Verticillium longisporum]